MEHWRFFVFFFGYCSLRLANGLSIFSFSFDGVEGLAIVLSVVSRSRKGPLSTMSLGNNILRILGFHTADGTSSSRSGEILHFRLAGEIGYVFLFLQTIYLT